MSRRARLPLDTATLFVRVTKAGAKAPGHTFLFVLTLYGHLRLHEVFSAFIHSSAETAYQVLVDIAHHPVRHGIWMQVDGCEILSDFVQDTLSADALNHVGEVELLESRPDVLRELRD